MWPPIVGGTLFLQELGAGQELRTHALNQLGILCFPWEGVHSGLTTSALAETATSATATVPGDLCLGSGELRGYKFFCSAVHPGGGDKGEGVTLFLPLPGRDYPSGDPHAATTSFTSRIISAGGQTPRMLLVNVTLYRRPKGVVKGMGPGLRGSEGCCVGSACRSSGMDEGKDGKLLPRSSWPTSRQPAGPRGLCLMSGLGEEPPMLILLMTVIISYFVTTEQISRQKSILVHPPYEVGRTGT